MFHDGKRKKMKIKHVKFLGGALATNARKMKQISNRNRKKKKIKQQKIGVEYIKEKCNH